MTAVVETLNLGHGPRTVMVKDTIDVAGYATRAGSRALAQAAAAQQHAAVVSALLEAGWQINGKTNLHELAFGTTGINHWTGTPVNPDYPTLIPGGSSSGSAVAVAAGLCDAALGTDTGGSVRTPAACCGVFGFKPTFGRVSRAGVIPAVSSLDCVGPFSRNMDTLIQVMAAITPDFAAVPEFSSLPAKPLGVLTSAAQAEISTTLTRALEQAALPQIPVALPGMQEAYSAGMVIINRETWNACEPLVASGLIGSDVADRLLAASQTSDEQLAQAEQTRDRFTAEVDRLLQHCLVLAMPTLPDYPVALADAADTRALLGMTSFVRPFNLTGHPAITLPLQGPSGLPVGLQLVAGRGQDELLCSVARELSERLELNRV